MIKRVRKTKVASVVLFLCTFIISAYAYLYRSSIWKPQRIPANILPWNYTNNVKNKNVSVEKKGPNLTLTRLSVITIDESLRYSEIENRFFKGIESVTCSHDAIKRENLIRSLEQKDVVCNHVVRHGNQHEGGWNVCMSPPFILKKPCLVYSFGIGNDWRFEDDVHDRYGCEVMAFDPSINLIEHDRLPKIKFKPLGLGARNRVTEKGWKLKTFKQHLKDERHSKAVIDYLKFDVEDMEWRVIENLVKDQSLTRVKQIGFEIHLRDPLTPLQKNFTLSRSDFVEKHKVLQLLEKSHFKEFSYRLNPFCIYKSKKTGKERSYCYELNYLNFRFVEKKDLRSRTLS